MTDRTDDPTLDPEKVDAAGEEILDGDTSPPELDIAPETHQDDPWWTVADPPGVAPEEDLTGAGAPLPTDPAVVDGEDEFAGSLVGEAEPGGIDDEPGRALPPPVSEPLPVDSLDEVAAIPDTDDDPVVDDEPEPADESFVPLTPGDTTESFDMPEPADTTEGPVTDQPGAAEPPAVRTAGAAAAASGFFGGLMDRARSIGSGSDETGPEEQAVPVQAPAATPLPTRMANAIRGYFDPRLSLYTTRPHRWLLGVSAVVILLSLLAGSGGLALLMLSVIAPLMVVITLTQLDVFEKESNLIVAGVIAAAALAGMVLGGVASWIQGEQWFDTGKLNYGAGGFSGPFADAAGGPPVVVWLMSGVVLGAVGTAAIGGAAVALRRFPQFRNEAMDSVIIGGAAAAGYVIGLSVVYWWPMVGNPGPVTSVQDWTLRIIGIGILRPAAFTLCGALLGFGVWLYATNRSFSVAGVPAMLGGLGLFLLNLVPTTLQASGAWSEAIVTAILFAVAFPAYRFALDNAIEIDRQALGDEGNRIVCPACHKVTPMGDFCAHCGQRLDATGVKEAQASPGA